MAFQVSYKDRDGKQQTVSGFATRPLADGFARTHKGAMVSEAAGAASVARVTRCPEGTAELQLRATKDYYAPVNAARRGLVIPQAETCSDNAEHQAERAAELYGGARLDGLSVSDALDLANACGA